MGRFYVHIIVERSCWYPLNFSGSKVRSCDRDANRQKARNVLLASADIYGGTKLHEELKECLSRRLLLTEIQVLFKHFLLQNLCFCLRSRWLDIIYNNIQVSDKKQHFYQLWLAYSLALLLISTTSIQ